MRSDNHMAPSNAGFTLVEIIIAITISAILAVVLVQFMTAQTGRSWLPIGNLNQNLALQSAMDQITSDHRNLLLTATEPLVALQTKINSGDYWSDPGIQATNYCFDFAESSPGSGEWRETGRADTCLHPDHTLLKVTLSFGGQTLTSLFSR
jgi:prepilin-type N-terminal cleavage/methylation domain-containing protein